MYPAAVDPETESGAERELFHRFADELSDDWAVLHSLGMSVHDRKLWAQIDFVAVGPRGIFCLEVKGGRVARKAGKWLFTNRHGRTTEKNEGPFEQAGSATAALRRYLRGRIKAAKHATVGFGVMMPDIVFNAEGPDIDVDVLYDERNRDEGLGAYVRRLADVWRSRLESRHRGWSFRPLSPKDCAAVVEALRPDFDLRPSLRARVGRARGELLRLTREQYRVLDGLSANDRVIVRGGAGSGKTLLAAEEATRQAAAGRRVFLCCFNRRLAEFLRRALADVHGVHVAGLHAFMAEMIRDAGLNHKLPDAEPSDLFEVFYPDVCVEALVELDLLETYDILLMDEGQDVARPAYLDVLDALLRGGLERGCWRFFYDPNQDIFEAIDPAGMKRLLDATPAQFDLAINCRNTSPVAVNTELLSGVSCRETLVVEGPEVEYFWYHDDNEQRRLVSNHLNRLISSGIAVRDIVILSRRRLENTFLTGGLPAVPFPILELDELSADPDSMVRFATVSSFKGLEADAVLLVGIDDLEGDDSLHAIYVGASRARVLLSVFLHQSTRRRFGERSAAFGRRIVSGSLA
jgi:hypothetical protein